MILQEANHVEPLVAVVTTDLSAVTRGRFVAAENLDRIAERGIGWVPANLALTPQGAISAPNPWGSRGDLRIVPDVAARYKTNRTGSITPFDLVCGDLVEIDGSPWPCCTRTLLRDAAQAFGTASGLTVIASFEQEFQLVFDGKIPAEHPMSFSALRRTDPFGPLLMAALDQSGMSPETVLAEFGRDQFEVTCAPAEAVTAADHCVAIREITREIARNMGWRASFAPKTSLAGGSNGVHIHVSFRTSDGHDATHAPEREGGLSALAGAFCAGVLRHLPAITAMTAPSPPSYYRLVPHNWSSAYTTLALQDREAAMRICPGVTIGTLDRANQFNIEYRVADATANPYLALTLLLRAGIEGIKANLSPHLTTVDPEEMSEADRLQLGLFRLPTSLQGALEALAADPIVNGWFDRRFIETFRGIKDAELCQLVGEDPERICVLYRDLY